MSKTIPLVFLAIACTTPEAPPPTEPVAPRTIPVTVDDERVAPLTLPEGPGPWALTAVMPPGVPAFAAWHEVEVTSATGRFLRIKRPAERQAEELRVVLRDGAPAIGTFATTAGDRGLQLVVEPSSVNVRTGPQAAVAPKWPLLRVSIDGRGVGRLTEEEAAVLPRTAMPGRPQREGGWRLQEVLATRLGSAKVAAVSLLVVGGDPVEVSADDLATGLWLVRQTQKGTFNVKHYAEGERDAVTWKDVQGVDVRTRP